MMDCAHETNFHMRTRNEDKLAGVPASRIRDQLFETCYDPYLSKDVQSYKSMTREKVIMGETKQR